MLKLWSFHIIAHSAKMQQAPEYLLGLITEERKMTTEWFLSLHNFKPSENKKKARVK